MTAKVILPTVLLGLTVLAAALFRLPQLGERPMHADEAVQAIRFGQLLESGDYVYDPWEFHGPSLNYLTLPVTWLSGVTQLIDVREADLRLVPALFGIVLVGLTCLLQPELGWTATLCAALLTAVCPMTVYYSRYYIHETLLACFTFGAIAALWRWRQAIIAATSPSDPARSRTCVRPTLWLLLLGFCLGMMHASKETCVIHCLAIAVAAAVTMRDLRHVGFRRLAVAPSVTAVGAACVSAILFSSFLQHPRGVVDSFTTYTNYLGRGMGEGEASHHVHPWHYYLEVLFWWQRGQGPLWSQLSVALLAAVGLFAAIPRLGHERDAHPDTAPKAHGLHPMGLSSSSSAESSPSPQDFSRDAPATISAPLVQFLAIYCIVTLAVYSLVPYKTPWCALGLCHGLLLLAGVGAAVALRIPKTLPGKLAIAALLAAAAGQLAHQAWQANFLAAADPNNPYVYAHTTADVVPLARRIEELANVELDGEPAAVQVIYPDHDYWPLPWYLRSLDAVGWLDRMPNGPPAPLIVIPPELEGELADYLYRRQPPGQRSLYVPVPPEPEDRDWQLRTHAPLQVYARLDLWEKAKESATTPQ